MEPGQKTIPGFRLPLGENPQLRTTRQPPGEMFQPGEVTKDPRNQSRAETFRPAAPARFSANSSGTFLLYNMAKVI
ncbi:hypothetical protein C4J81_12425 [Deltaproteobacteria bacterium Smac51]|nr:hypothetical protein C4J81_12425 [Deltaproteobacteria bacterium Smac51]